MIGNPKRGNKKTTSEDNPRYDKNFHILTHVNTYKTTLHRLMAKL